MKRLWKVLRWALLLLVVLLLSAFGIAYFHKKEIIATIKEGLKKNVNGDIDFKDLTFSVLDEFPAVSVTLEDFYIRGPRYNEYTHDFLNASKVYVRVALGPLIRKRVVIESIRITHGEVYVFRSRSGYTNLDVFRRSDGADSVKSGEPVDISFNRIQLEDIGVFYRDSLKNKMVGLRFINVNQEITATDSSVRFRVTGPIRFEGLTLNPAKGSYLKEKEVVVNWDIESVTLSHRLIVHPSNMVFAKSTVQLNGQFWFGGNGHFQLNIKSDRLNYTEGLSLITQALQSKLDRYFVEQPIRFTARLSGQLAAGDEPAVDLSFDFVNSPVTISKNAFDKISVSGEFMNHVDSLKPHNDANSMILIKNSEATYRGVPVHLRVRFLGLADPRVDATMTINTDLKALKSIEDSTRTKILGGKLKSRFDYSGSLREIMDSTATTYSGKLSGFLQIQDGTVKYLPRAYDFKKLNLMVHFDQTHTALDSLSVLWNQSPLFIKGDATGFVPFFIQPHDKGLVVVKVYSPSFDLTQLLAKAKDVPVKPKQKNPKSFLGTLYNKVKFELELQVRKLQYKHLTGTNLYGKVALNNLNLTARNFSMKVAGGDVSFSATLNPAFAPTSALNFNSKVRNADIKQFFYSFDDFKMTSLTHDHLEGKLDADITFSSMVNDEFTIQLPSLKSSVDLTIRKGRIINFEPLQNMSNFLMKNRDFGDVQFGEIKSRLTVSGTEIDIQRMEIEASVIRMFIEGRYSMKDSTDLSIQLPLSNLKKRNKTDKLENVGVDAKVGMSIFLHVYEDQGKMVIAYDPFKKHVRKSPDAAKKSNSK